MPDPNGNLSAAERRFSLGTLHQGEWSAWYAHVTTRAAQYRVGLWCRMAGERSLIDWGWHRNRPWWSHGIWSLRVWRFSVARQNRDRRPPHA